MTTTTKSWMVELAERQAAEYGAKARAAYARGDQASAEVYIEEARKATAELMRLRRRR